MSKRLGRIIIGCKYKIISWHLNGFPDGIKTLCVFFPFILDVRLVGRTSRGHTGGGCTGLLIHLPSAVLALIFLARMIQPVLSLVDREVEFFVLTI